MTSHPSLYPLSAVAAAGLGLHGFRSGSLSRSGAIAAAAFGYSTLANPLSTFSIALLSFYFTGSRITKIKAAYKATLEDSEHDPSLPPPKKAGGNRDAWQVASNAAFGAACAVCWRHLAALGAFDPALSLLTLRPGYQTWSPALIFGAISFWSACAGDTFASELGILSTLQPRLITTLRTVPKGTNGGVSTWGLLMSLAGGLVVGSASVAALALEDKAAAGLTFGARRWPWWIVVMAVAGGSGLVGSLLDSVLGATVQQTLYSPSRSKIVHHKEAHPTEVLQVRGYNLLSNNGVNVASTTATAAAVVWAVRRWA